MCVCVGLAVQRISGRELVTKEDRGVDHGYLVCVQQRGEYIWTRAICNISDTC